MSLKRVLIVNKSYPAVGLKLLHDNKIQTTVIPHLDHDPEMLPEIKNHLPLGFDALIWNTKFKYTKELMDLAGPGLKVISSMSSGLDHIDVGEVKQRGCRLGHVLKVLDDAVADITVGLMIAAARRFKEGVQEIESGEWKYGVQWRLGVDIAGSTVGIVGLGGIGQAVVQRLKGFNVGRFIYCGRTDKPEAKSLDVERVAQDQLVRESDFIVLTCPLSDATRHMINADAINTMKNTAVIVNVGRGELIDQEALYNALKEDRIFAAGLDVTTPEPLAKDHPLVLLPNCYIVPHVGSATVGTRDTMAIIAAKNIIQGLNGQPMVYPAF